MDKLYSKQIRNILGKFDIEIFIYSLKGDYRFGFGGNWTSTLAEEDKGCYAFTNLGYKICKSLESQGYDITDYRE